MADWPNVPRVADCRFAARIAWQVLSMAFWPSGFPQEHAAVGARADVSPDDRPDDLRRDQLRGRRRAGAPGARRGRPLRPPVARIEHVQLGRPDSSVMRLRGLARGPWPESAADRPATTRPSSTVMIGLTERSPPIGRPAGLIRPPLAQVLERFEGDEEDGLADAAPSGRPAISAADAPCAAMAAARRARAPDRHRRRARVDDADLPARAASPWPFGRSGWCSRASRSDRRRRCCPHLPRKPARRPA